MFFIVGCASAPKYINNSKNYTSIGIDYHDIQEVVDKNAKSLLKSRSVQKIPEDKRILAISDIINDTKDDIDVELLSRKLATKIRNDGFILSAAISGNALSTDEILKSTRNIRNNEEFNQKTIVNKGNLIAPNYSLSGKIIQRSRNVGKKERLDYYFLLTLTDIATGLVVWDNETIISKVIDKKELDQYANNPPSKSPKTSNKAKGFFSNYLVIGLETRLVNYGGIKIPSISLKPYGYGNYIEGVPEGLDDSSRLSLDVKLGYMLSLNESLAFQFNALYSYSSLITKKIDVSYYSSWRDSYKFKDIGLCMDCSATAGSHKLGGELLLLVERGITKGFYVSGGLLADIYSNLRFDIHGIHIEQKFNSFYPFVSLGWTYFYDKFGINIGTKYEWSVDDENYFSQGWSLLTLGLFLKL
ncbi:hypothetical protein BKH45_01700 [Helicobacter sp. 11S03491-1]|nr:hypothetical protein BKH45_01700 [Helicobacter sp. 11S03491-1]